MPVSNSRITVMSPRGQVWLSMLEGGHRLKAYKDSAGIPTIGAGLTYYPDRNMRVRMGDKLESAEAARELFRQALRPFEQAVDAYTPDNIEEHVFDAFVSAAYNIGIAAFRSSTFVKRFNARDSIESVCEALSWFKHETVDGKARVNPGLQARRACEIYLIKNKLYRLQGGP